MDNATFFDDELLAEMGFVVRKGVICDADLHMSRAAYLLKNTGSRLAGKLPPHKRGGARKGQKK